MSSLIDKSVKESTRPFSSGSRPRVNSGERQFKAKKGTRQRSGGQDARRMLYTQPTILDEYEQTLGGG